MAYEFEQIEAGVFASAQYPFVLSLPPGWLSCDASSVAKTFGLPPGARDRATPMDFGPHLRAHFCGRFDLVAFKYLELIASTLEDNKTKAMGDIRALQPTAEERAAAQDWLMNTPKGSQGWKDLVQRAMSKALPE